MAPGRMAWDQRDDAREAVPPPPHLRELQSWVRHWRDAMLLMALWAGLIGAGWALLAAPDPNDPGDFFQLAQVLGL